MWIVEKYIKYLVGFALLWGILFAYRSCGCAKVFGTSMTPALKSEEFVRIWVGSKNLQAQDLVYFYLSVPNSKEDGYLGRVIGLPGDKIAMKDGTIIVNGKDLPEAYITAEFVRRDESINEIIVPANHLYVLCDNRREGNPPDSRRFGPIPINAVWGKVAR